MASASDGHRLYADARNERDETQEKLNDVINELVQITEHLIANKEEVMIVISEKDKELQNEKRVKNELHADFIQLCHDNATLASQLDDKQLQVISLRQREKKLTMQCTENEKVIVEQQNAFEEAHAKHTEEVAAIKMEFENRIHAMEDTIETKVFEVEELQINLEELQEGMKDKRREIETLTCQINNWKTTCKQSEYGYEILRKKHEESKKENKLQKRKMKGEPTYENDLNNKPISIEDNTEELMGSGMSRIHAMEVKSVKTNALIVEKRKALEKAKELKNELHENFLEVCHDIAEINERNTKLALQLDDKPLQVILLSRKEKKLTMQCTENEINVLFRKQNASEEAKAKHMDEVNMLKMEYENRIHAMEDTIETKAFEVEEIQINLEELQEGMKDKRREIETLTCQINNWKTTCKQSEYGYEILRKKHEESKKENKLQKRKMKDEPTYENDLNNKPISIEDNTEELMGSGMSLIQVDSGCFLDNMYLIPSLKQKALD